MLEDGGGRVGIRALVLQTTRVPPPLALEVRQVRRAPLRRTDFEQFGTDNCPGCANARAGRKQAVGHSEQCRSRMETILSTTTDGDERLERARDRFAEAAKEPEDEEPQRKRHRPEGEGEQPLAPPGEGSSSSSSSGSTLPHASPAPAPLESPPLAKRGLDQETENLTRPSNNRENQRGGGSIQKCLNLRTAAVAAAVKAQPTLKWAWWTCVQFSVSIPRQKVDVKAVR